MMKKSFNFWILFLLLSHNSFSQNLDFKILVGNTETEVKQLIKGFTKIKEEYIESGKSVGFYFNNYTVIYDFNSNKVCNKTYLIFNNNESASKMNQWFYENSYAAIKAPQSGEIEQWSGITPKGISVRALKVNYKSYYFANLLSTLLGD